MNLPAGYVYVGTGKKQNCIVLVAGQNRRGVAIAIFVRIPKWKSDHKVIRKLYEGLFIKTVTTKYTISRDVKAKLRDRAELLISNYKLPKS